MLQLVEGTEGIFMSDMWWFLDTKRTYFYVKKGYVGL